jgi:hypothetical protein
VKVRFFPHEKYDVRYPLCELKHSIGLLLREKVMKKIKWLSASIRAVQSARLGYVQVITGLFLMMTVAIVHAGSERRAQVIELHFGSAPSDGGPRGRLSTPPRTENFSAPPSSSQAVSVLSQKRSQGTFPRQRNPELSPQHIVVLGLNAKGQETSRTIMLDPRILRAETAESIGKKTSSEFLYRKDVKFSIMIPDDADAVTLKIYKPRWTGKAFALDLIGQTNLPEVSHD